MTSPFAILRIFVAALFFSAGFCLSGDCAAAPLDAGVFVTADGEPADAHCLQHCEAENGASLTQRDTVKLRADLPLPALPAVVAPEIWTPLTARAPPPPAADAVSHDGLADLKTVRLLI